ncbi:hypothetical protein LEP1GSC058_1389 [Leptospira fainei serovar Hurstbridge str. BUT 6]|uniref:Uncharacterized protein n=1 Tax=Leptospira fainei serovar Hurstbridge str. BUT 6 TaxID=1193011 RepID=S3VIF2_9LEPT|nr:hypothetical protein LEP1GSC058_1389 [Leptospira fainei serovar Hurstbridge str. BUT 6]
MPHYGARKSILTESLRFSWIYLRETIYTFGIYESIFKIIRVSFFREA